MADLADDGNPPMYGFCIYCKRALGTNTIVESFPIGTRLAFDPARGRLWVVCRRCERWNLSPLEERWEACEDCERLFRSTRLRASTDNVGLAKLPEGLEIVRIGTPLRPEFAAWRYGDQFGRRRTRAIVWTAAGVAAAGALTAGSIAVGAGAAFAPQVPNLLLNLHVRARVRLSDGRVLKLKRPDLHRSRILQASDAGDWVLQVRYARRTLTFAGGDARRVAAQILPAINYLSGSRATVRTAVARIEEAGDPERYLGRLWREIAPAAPFSGHGQPLFPGKPGMLHRLPPATRLAIEMALHEEQEMRALMGELLDLELAWREAEEVARIADDMLVPSEIRATLARMRTSVGRGAGSTPETD